MKFILGNMAETSKVRLAALSLLVILSASAAYADEDTNSDEEDIAADQSTATGHWYLGASTGYLKPDGARLSGNTRTLGFQGGYQFSDKWSLEAGVQQDAFGPGNDNLNIHSLNFIRSWGDSFRVLFEFGATNISLDGAAPDRATSGFHVGAGLSSFLTDNWELRGDLRLPYSMNGRLLDALGTLSLNYHFVEPRVLGESEGESVLGTSEENNQSLPPMAYREPAQAEEPEQSETVAPTPEVATAETAQPEPAEEVAPQQTTAVTTTSDNTNVDFVAANAVPKSTHTLLNFASSSVDPKGQYSQQLDQVAQEINSSNGKAVIEGHTDDKGSAANNKVLSLDRAIVVKQELKKRGVDGKKLRAVGYGAERPVATNATKEGRAQNRRVEVKVYDSQQ